MRGFRDLDPGEAEQVVSTRRRKIEYLEEQLYAPLVDGYSAAPSEDGPEERPAAEPARKKAEYKRPERPRREYRERDYGTEREAVPVRSRSAKRAQDESESYRGSEDYDEPYYEPETDVRQDYKTEQDYEAEREYEEDEPYYEAVYEYDDDEDASYRRSRRVRRPISRRTAAVTRRAVMISALFAALIIGIVIFTSRRSRGAAEPEVASEPESSFTDIAESDITDVSEWTGENGGGGADPGDEEQPEEESAYQEPSDEAGLFFEGYEVTQTESTEDIVDDDVQSEYAVLIDMKTGEVMAGKQANAIIYPASMTKILTLLVAVEHLSDLDATVTMTQEVGDIVFRKDLSAVGYQVGDVIPVRDLLYGTILPSGADAALLLAEHVAGSQEAFVDMMNERVEELGLSDTAHFANTVGLYDPDNHCTMTDMAMILKAAVENELCREVLSAHIYTTAPTPDHPDGIEISNWFLRRIEDKDTHGEVICAKTGFVDQSGCCAASYQISNDGGRYICVTGNAWSSWRCIYDHVRIYDLYTE